MRCLAAAALLSLAPAALGADWGIAQLFQTLAREHPGRAAFQERRFVSLLDRPLESSGELAFVPPDTMEKRTVAPRPERVTVDRDRLTIERSGKRHSLGLRENPAVAVLVDGLRATLAGDLDALVRSYSAALEGSAQRWRLTLRPLDPAASGLVERIDISGAQARVQAVEILQADGDRSVMTITPVAR